MSTAPRTIDIPFRGPYARVAPFTWGQSAIAPVLRWLGPDDASLNLTNVIPVEGECGVEDVLTALSELMARHDVLHTTFEVRGGEEIQVVSESGTLRVEIHDASSDAEAGDAAGRIRDALGAIPFDTTRDLPIRAAVITADGRPRHVALASGG